MNNPIENSTSIDESPILKNIDLSKIVGLHPCIEQLFNKLSIPPFRALAKNALPAEQINNLMSVFPIRAILFRKRLRCTGNFRLYQLATKHLPPNQLIPCIIDAPAADSELQLRATQELLLAPAAMGVHFSEIKMLAAIARRAITAKKLAVAKTMIDDAYLSKLYGIDRRQLAATTIGQQSTEKHSDQKMISEVDK